MFLWEPSWICHPAIWSSPMSYLNFCFFWVILHAWCILYFILFSVLTLPCFYFTDCFHGFPRKAFHKSQERELNSAGHSAVIYTHKKREWQSGQEESQGAPYSGVLWLWLDKLSAFSMTGLYLCLWKTIYCRCVTWHLLSNCIVAKKQVDTIWEHVQPIINKQQNSPKYKALYHFENVGFSLNCNSVLLQLGFELSPICYSNILHS